MPHAQISKFAAFKSSHWFPSVFLYVTVMSLFFYRHESQLISGSRKTMKNEIFCDFLDFSHL